MTAELGVAHRDGDDWGQITGSPPEPVRFERLLLPNFQNLDNVAFVRNPDDPAFAIMVTYASVLEHYAGRANPTGMMDADAVQPLRTFIISQLTSLPDTKRERDRALDRLRRKLDRVASAASGAGGTVTRAMLVQAGLI